MKAYLIDALARTITEIDYEYHTLCKYLPGGITLGYVYDNGDTLYVDDEGLLRKAEKAFRIKERPDGQPMMSNGVLTGMDSYEDEDNGTTLPPVFAIAELQDRIEWLTVDEALAWFRNHAHQPAVTIHSAGSAHVAAQWVDILDNLEGRKGYHPRDMKW